MGLRSTRPQPRRPNTAEPRLAGVAALGQRLVGAFSTVTGMLTLAGVAAVVVGLALVMFLAELRTMGLSILALGAILLLAVFVTRLSRLNGRVARRQQRYGVITLVMVLAVLGIASFVNLISANNVILVDMTATRQFSLAPQTISVLDDLNQQVQATAFFTPASQQDPSQGGVLAQMEDFLHEFERRSGGRFTYRVVDPEEFPDIARAEGARQWPLVVFDAAASGKRYGVLATGNPEQDFLTAVLAVTGVKQKAIYILGGYSSRVLQDLTPGSIGSLGFAWQGMEGDNYSVQELTLLQEATIPDDAAALIVVGPSQDLSADQASTLDAYLEGGGRLIALLEPNPPQTWTDLLARWGITVAPGYVIDPSSHVAGTTSTPIVQPSQYGASSITAQLDLTFFPGLAPVTLVRPPEEMPNASFDVIGVSSNDSFAGASLYQTGPKPSDPLGPFIVGAVARAKGPVDQPLREEQASLPTTTEAVVGDADFISNKYFYSFSNGDLFLNLVDDVTGDVALISVRPKPVVSHEMVMTSNELNTVRYAGWLLLPLVVAAAGVAVWWRRR